MRNIQLRYIAQLHPQHRTTDGLIASKPTHTHSDSKCQKKGNRKELCSSLFVRKT